MHLFLFISLFCSRAYHTIIQSLPPFLFSLPSLYLSHIPHLLSETVSFRLLDFLSFSSLLLTSPPLHFCSFLCFFFSFSPLLLTSPFSSVLYCSLHFTPVLFTSFPFSSVLFTSILFPSLLFSPLLILSPHVPLFSPFHFS